MPHAAARGLLYLSLALALAIPPHAAHAASHPGPPLTIRRATGPITIDGELGDAGWQGADSVTTWFETRVGDNVEPQVRNVAFLTYDAHYLYAGFVFDDPNPGAIRGPYADHDALSPAMDYAGLYVDGANDGKTAQIFVAGPRGLQYDAITNDATGEDSSPDYFWDARGRITKTGWNLEIRIPLTSLRYPDVASPTWGVILYRNYPRERRYQFFSTRMPRGVNCFICNESELTGLTGLPHGSHLVVAPYGTARQSRTAAPGDPLRTDSLVTEAGADLKWSPSPGLTLDGTINPDFSQIESDAAQIVANERFALFYPEKRPFFLEGVDLLSTPINATYTRTITDPKAGARATGRVGGTAFTGLVTQDEGGGAVILPGPQGSDFAAQDFVSDVGIARLRHDIGTSFVSVLANTREIHGGGHNRVAGPDLNWRPYKSESIRGQYLWSETQTPDRTDLAGEWDGRRLSGHAAFADWGHTGRVWDNYFEGQDISSDFRSYNGFVPQVGYREGYYESGLTWRPKDRFVSRERFFTVDFVDVDEQHNVLNQRVSVGTGADGKFNSFTRVELNADAIRTGATLIRRFRPRFYVESSPGSVINFVNFDSYFGEEIDFANERPAHGATLNASLELQPGAHLRVTANGSVRWIDVNAAEGRGRLFTAQVERVRATWMFGPQAFIRLIGQYTDTRRDPALYTFAVPVRTSSTSGSALFAYKLNWQTVFYAGYGDDRAFTDLTDRIEPVSQQWFTKLSYALQR